ncbi:MAG: metal-dependent transcriptional regulator [Bacteroidia bacterium]
MPSSSGENYLKAIYKIGEKTEGAISTNAIAAQMNTTAASVTDMLKKLAGQKFILYKKYKGVQLTPKGEILAKDLIRKHRLWEVFLVNKLNFTWDEVHDLAEELEHIGTETLVNKLDDFLDNPKFDPHGDPIPDKNGKFHYREQVLMTDLAVDEEAIIVGVQDHSPGFLQYLDQIKLVLGTRLKIRERIAYDKSLSVALSSAQSVTISYQVAKNLFVKSLHKNEK